MRTNLVLAAGMALAVVLMQAGCSKENGPNQSIVAPEQSSVNRGGSYGVPGRAPSPSNPRALPGAASQTLSEGTSLVVRTTNSLSTKTHIAGQSFSANLEQPLALNGREVLAKGAEVEGVIVGIDKGGRVKGLATIAVQMTRLRTADGRSVEISTNTITRDANATKKKDALKIGIGSGVGAAIGAIAGGGKGAAIGAAAGAGAGTGVVLATHGDAAVIPSESVLHFALRAPVTVAGLR